MIATAAPLTIETNTMTVVEELQSIYCDMYKDVYGFKARWVFGSAEFDTEEKCHAELGKLADQMEIEDKRREEEQAWAIREFEALVERTMDTGAGDRATAIRWLTMASPMFSDLEFFDFEYGLPYGYTRKALGQ